MVLVKTLTDMKLSTIPQPLILIDAHVHIHDCFKLEAVFDAAWDNFQYFAQKQACNQGFQGVLCLTEMEGVNYFEYLVKYAQSHTVISGWHLKTTQESVSIYARKNPEREIAILAGRQVVTAEKLEVLGLITNSSIPSGLPLVTTIKKILDGGGLPVIPWGFGKWLGKRGKLLNQLLQNSDFPCLFWGDSGLRPTFIPQPQLLKQVQRKKIPIISGTDPLSLTSESSRPGSFGVAITGNLSLATPGTELKQIILDDQSDLQSFGDRQKPLRFIYQQLALRLPTQKPPPI